MHPMKRKDTLPTIWELGPHTAAKHKILRDYLGAWFAILGRRRVRLMFLDGFAGPGTYSGGEPGSPVVALETLLGHSQFANLEAEFVFIFLEADEERYASLIDQLEKYRTSKGGWPATVSVVTACTTFEQAAREILDDLTDQRRRLAPTFAFIDPFGFAGIPMSLLCQLLAFDKCEVFLNFMSGPIGRWGSKSTEAFNLRELFGTEEYESGLELDEPQRLTFLLDLYKRQLRDRCDFKYVISFKMVHESGLAGNYLVYGTRSLKGLEVMKRAMWSTDPAGGVAFSDRAAGQEVLFSKENTDVGPLRTELLARFRGKEATVEQVHEFVLASTPYSGSHYKRVLGALERDRVITVKMDQRKRRLTYPSRTRLLFHEGV